MRRTVSYITAVPLAALGSLLAHQVAYLASARTPVASAGHAWLRYWPAIAGALAAAVLVGAVAESVRAWRRRAAPGVPPAWPFALVAPLAFVAQEAIEQAVAGGRTFSVAGSTVLLGLILQVPVAVLTWRLTRALLAGVRRLAQALGSLRARPVPARGADAVFPACVVRSVPRGSRLLAAAAGRAPPSLSVLPQTAVRL